MAKQKYNPYQLANYSREIQYNEMSWGRRYMTGNTGFGNKYRIPKDEKDSRYVGFFSWFGP